MQIKVLFHGTAGNCTAEIVDRLLLMTGGLDLHTQVMLPALTLYTLELQNDKNKQSVGQ